MPLDCYFCKKIATLDQPPPDELVWLFPFSVAFLGPWQFYRGYCILASRVHATELSQLDDETRLNFLDEMCLLARAVEECFQPRKLNYEMLGNQTPHLHWHVIPRYRNDPDAAHSIWQAIDRVKNDRAARQRLKEGAAGQGAGLGYADWAARNLSNETPMTRAETIAVLRKRLQVLVPGNP